MRRCVLPETHPRLTFDAEGVCSVCREWRSPPVQGLRVIAASFDNGFGTEQAARNMLTACSLLDVPFIDINETRGLASTTVFRCCCS